MLPILDLGEDPWTCQSGCCLHALAKGTMSIPGGGVQGAFILVGSNTVGPELLVVLTIGVLVYAAWRFWEAVVGQGSDAAYGAFKNFFKFRCLPFGGGRRPGGMPCAAR